VQHKESAAAADKHSHEDSKSAVVCIWVGGMTLHLQQ